MELILILVSCFLFLQGALPFTYQRAGPLIQMDSANATAANSTTNPNNTPDVGAIDLSNFNFTSDPSKMPALGGPPVTKTTLPAAPAHIVHGSVNRDRLAPGTQQQTSKARTRSIDALLNIEACRGSLNGSSGHMLYGTETNQSAIGPFLQSASAYALEQYNAGSLGAEANHNYFRYTAGPLSMVAIAYGAAASGNEPFNWGDYSGIADWLLNLTHAHPENNVTYVGLVRDSQGNPYVDFSIVPSIGDVAINSSTASSTNLPSGQGGGGRRLLLSRNRQAFFGFGRMFRTDIHTGTRKVMAYIMWDLVKRAYMNILADSGANPFYTTGTFRLDGGSTDSNSNNNPMFQIVTVGDHTLSRSQMLDMLETLLQLLKAWDWDRLAAETMTLYGKIFNYKGQVVGNWSLGQSIVSAVHCVAENPDGSIAYACFVREEL